MNTPIRRISVALLLLVAALLLNVNYVQVVQAGSLDARPDNRRVLLDEYGRERGPILVDGEERIARSVPSDDALRYLRVYDDPERYAPVTGFYSFIFGRRGIEATANETLSGSGPRFFVRSLVDLVSGTEPRGGSVLLTIDPRAQRAAFDALGDRSGAVVAIQPSTGAILALVSKPTYDPNELSSHSDREQQTAWERLTEDPGRPLANRATAETYPPGSVFKIVTAAAALESGRYTPESEVPGPARLPLPDTTITLPNQNRQPCGPGDEVTLTRALAVSCNTAFASIGLDLGADALRAQAQRFGYDDTPMSDLTSAVSRFPADPDRPQTAISSIGQFDVRATPLQVAMTSAAVANNGVLMAPYLIQETRSPDLDVLTRHDPQQVSQAVSPATAAGLTRMMEAVVTDGTGGNAAIDGIAVAGKTGTAERGRDRPPLAWFTSFAPADDPRVAVAVVVEDAGTETDISGGRLAAPIARAVMEAVLGE